ncbi:hypothetical protein K8T06_00995 [bacterium]|nr:hypothetical protein [bacterium]
MDVFKIHEAIMLDYQLFIESFINISDVEIRRKIDEELSSGKLWPKPLIQFNPSFAEVAGIDDLIKEDVLCGQMRDVCLDVCRRMIGFGLLLVLGFGKRF